MKVLITGSCGLIGSEATRFYCDSSASVVGIDNNMRKYFFGIGGDTSPLRAALSEKYSYYSDLGKLESHFPDFRLSMSLNEIISDTVRELSEAQRKAA